MLENITNSFASDRTPKTVQAKTSQELLNKKEQFFLFQLDSPLTNFSCLLPNDLEISLSLTFSEGLTFFCTHTQNCKPKIILDDIRLIPQLILLREPLLNSINRRLLSHNLQIPYYTWVSKIHTIQVGMLDAYLDISIRDMETDMIIAIFMLNEKLLGQQNTNIHRWTRHNLINCYVETSHQMKIPTLLSKPPPF